MVTGGRTPYMGLNAKGASGLDTVLHPFVPPAPIPRLRENVPSIVEIVRTLMRNPLELWGAPSYEEKWIHTKFLNERSLIVNDPGLIRHVLVDNARNYRMATIRQLILRPILRDGLLTAEGDVWKRSRKAMAPVFTPRHIHGFAASMLARTEAYTENYAKAARDGTARDIARDMTELTFDMLSQTLFSGEIVTSSGDFAADVERLLYTMGHVDPIDLLKAPPWVPRLSRLRGIGVMAMFRGIVDQTMEKRRAKMTRGVDVPDDFLTLLLRQEGPDGLTREEIKDNIITFIGAGHETTARALGWTLYCLANAGDELALVEEEVDSFFARDVPPPEAWLDALPRTRAAFEEAMRLYPPAPSINRAAIADDRYGDVKIEKDVTVLIMPWTLHRHRKLWDRPTAFMPQRFWPENRGAIDKFQYLPFGAGPRICIGATFALQEAVIALAVLLHRFRFTCTKDCRPWPVQKLTTQPQGGLPMTVTARR
jgi:cytochrome P450